MPAVGDMVWIRRRRWRVVRVRTGAGATRFDVACRDGRRTFLAPFDRVVPQAADDRPRVVSRPRARTELGRALANAHSVRTPLAAVAARVEIFAHQLEPALAILSGRRRVLIADEVGLGKTVQAGLVIAELLRRDPLARALVLLPAALVQQWDDELRQRFDVTALVATAASLRALTVDRRRGASPWLRPGVWLASADFLKQPISWPHFPADFGTSSS